MFRNSVLLLLLSLVVTTSASVRFTKEPPKVLYVSKGHTARLVWKYYADNRDEEFDINSPKWNFYTRKGDVMNIASEDMFQNWKWIIHRDTCPPRLLNPTRVFKESQATLVIKNVTTADNGVYGCSIVLLRTSLLYNSKVTLSVIEKQALTNILTSTSSTSKRPTPPSTPPSKGNMTKKINTTGKVMQVPLLPLKGNVTKMSRNMTDKVVQDALLPLNESPAINKSLSDNVVKSWNNKSLSLKCILNGPTRANITWYNPKGHDVTNTSRLTKEGSQLFVTTQRDSDYGLYMCRAENFFGFDELNINVTNSCPCPNVRNSPKAAAFIGRKDSVLENRSPGSENKEIYMICFAIIGVSWIINVFLILQSRTMRKTEIRQSGSCIITDKTKQV